MSKELIDRIKASSEFTSYSSILSMSRSSIDCSSNTEEILRIHKLRSSRSMTKKSNTKNMIEVSISEMANRSRLVELRLNMHKVYNALNFAITTLHDFCRVKYSAHLGSNREQRDALLSSITSDGSQFLDQIASVLEISQEVISDIESTAWTLKRVVEIKELETRPENKI